MVENLKLLQDRVLILQDKAEMETTASGLVISMGTGPKPQTGTVIAVGPGRVSDNGIFIPTYLQKDQRVMFTKYGGAETEIDGETYLMTNERDIYGVIEDAG